MHRFIVLLVAALIGLGSPGFMTPVAQAQGPEVGPPAPRVVTAQGGYVGPCDSWWTTPAAIDFSLNAKRVCRVTTYLMQAFNSAESAENMREAVDGLFRICWGVVPQAGGDCRLQNAWAGHRSWVNFTLQAQRRAARLFPQVIPLPQPIVITLGASEVLQSDDEVAFSLAHEMGHANDPEPLRPNDRSYEQRADILAIGFLVNAGFDARAGGRSLQNLTGERGQGALGNLSQILNNHLTQVMTQDVHGFTMERIAAMKDAYRRGCAAMNNRPIGCKQGWN